MNLKNLNNKGKAPSKSPRFAYPSQPSLEDAEKKISALAQNDDEDEDPFLLDYEYELLHQVTPKPNETKTQASGSKHTTTQSNLKPPTSVSDKTPGSNSARQQKSLSPLRGEILKQQETKKKLQKQDSDQFDRIQNLPQFNPDVRLFKEDDTIEAIFDKMKLESTILNSMQGQTMSLFCFGNMKQPKGFNMYGNRDSNPGLVRLVLETLFAYIYKKVHTSFLIRVSYIEVHNEQVNDLLSPNSYKAAGQQVGTITEEICINLEQIFSLIRMGDINRQIGQRQGGDKSQKGHTIFRIIMEQTTRKKGQIRLTKINLVNININEFLPKRSSKQILQDPEQPIDLSNIMIDSLNVIIKFVCDIKDLNDDWVYYDEEELQIFIQNYMEQNEIMVWIGNSLDPSQGPFIYKEQSMLLNVKKTMKVLKYSRKRLDQSFSSSHCNEMEQELDEKFRLDSEIKKIQAQLLNSERVTPFMRKYDPGRNSFTEQTSARSSARKTQTQNRMAKRIEQANEFVEQLKLVTQKISNKNLSDTYNDMESQFESQLQLQEGATAKMGRLTVLEKALEKDQQQRESYLSEQSLLPSQMSMLDKDDFLLDSSPTKTELMLLNNDSNKILSTDQNNYTEGSEKDNKRQIEISNLDNDPDLLSQEQLKQFSDNSSDFGAIMEEENEEDSFELQRENQRASKQQTYLHKLDEIEARVGTTSGQLGDQLDSYTFQNQFYNGDEELNGDEDLLEHFESMERCSLIDLLDQQRDSVNRRPTLLFNKKSNNLTEVGAMGLGGQNQNRGSIQMVKRATKRGKSSLMPPTGQVSTQEVIKEDPDEFRESFKETDKIFLENLLKSRDHEVLKLREQLRISEEKQKKLMKDNIELQKIVQGLEQKLHEAGIETKQ